MKKTKNPLRIILFTVVIFIILNFVFKTDVSNTSQSIGVIIMQLGLSILLGSMIEIYLTSGKSSNENNSNTSATGTNKKPVSMKNNLIVLGVLVAIIAVIIVIQLIKK